MSGTGGFQTQVYGPSAPAVAGDFASLNPWSSVDAGPGGLVAGSPNGVDVGLFGWIHAPHDPNGTSQVVQNYGHGVPQGFVHRSQQGLITTFLDNASMTIPQGFQMAMMSGGDFWAKNDGTTTAQYGQKAWANQATGQVAFADAGGTAPGGASITGSIAAKTTTFHGAIVGDTLTVDTLVSGTIGIGSILTGGTGLVTGTRIVRQISGTAGGSGVYLVNYPNQSVAATLFTGTYGLLTVSAVSSGAIGIDDVLSGTGITTGTFVTALGTGTGNTGTYFVSPSQDMSSSALTVVQYIETAWYAVSNGAAGNLVKISKSPGPSF